MPSIRNIIMRKRKFIGRQKELQAMERLLAAHHEDWHILHFYGSAGMGKTVLLQQFMSMHEGELPIFYIDCHGGFLSTQDFLSALHKQLVDKKMMLPVQSSVSHVISELIYLARNHPVLVLILDGLDHCDRILQWLKDVFLNQLPSNIRVYTAGRIPFDNWQTDYGFESIVRNIHLEPFSKTEWTQYATACGITDEQLLYQIGFISQGIPLAVSLLCGRILEQGNLNRLTESDFRNLMQLFDKHLLSEENLDGVNSTLLSLASLTYTFDQELLEYMQGAPVSSKEFSKLCQSSFVRSYENGGWMVKNGIRWWVRANFRERFPTAYEQYKQRAETMLERRLSQSKNQIAFKLDLAIRKFYLKDSVFTQLVYFGNQHNLSVRAAKKEELPKLAKMYQHNLKISPPYLEDSSHQEQYFTAVWHADPTAFRIVEHEGQWLCFIAMVQLTQEIRSIFKNIPTMQNWIHSNEFGQNDMLYWIISANQPTDWQTIQFFLYRIFLPTLSSRRVICQMTLPDQFEFLKLIGFEYMPEAEYVTDNGFRFFYCKMDCREYSQPSDITTGENQDEFSIWITLTKKILNHYTALQRQLPLLEQCRQLWGSRLQDEEIIEHVQTIIEQQYEWLKEGTRQEKMQAKILQYAYMKKHGSHETVAALLDLPSSTYYRQLKKLTHSIALSLQSHTFNVDSVQDR